MFFLANLSLGQHRPIQFVLYYFIWINDITNLQYVLAKKYVFIRNTIYFVCARNYFIFLNLYNVNAVQQMSKQTKWTTLEKIERRHSANHFFIDFHSLSSSFFAHLAPSNFFGADTFNVMIEHADNDSPISIPIFFTAINQTENNTNRKLSNNFYWHLIDLFSDFR